ncbi:MAG: integration host factor subunit alpha [Deltaproteobacteria bacterium]|nr:integration host factor subunit alpha [Deltaproteobacteria bacterium]
MTLTKDRIIDSIYKNTDLMKSEAVQAFQSLMEIMKQTLESGEDILISGFGKFCVKEKKERKGRNPQTGNDLTLGARRVVTFKWSGKLKEKLNTKKKKRKKQK